MSNQTAPEQPCAGCVPEIEQLVVELVAKYVPQTTATPAAIARLTDLTGNLLSHLLAGSEEIARFKSAPTISAEHARLAVDFFFARCNTLRTDEAAALAAVVKNVKSMPVRPEESIVNPKAQENALLEKTKHLADVNAERNPRA